MTQHWQQFARIDYEDSYLNMKGDFEKKKKYFRFAKILFENGVNGLQGLMTIRTIEQVNHMIPSLWIKVC